MRRDERLLAGLQAFTAFARRRLGDDGLADDAVQDALARALPRLGDLRDDERLEAWFYRILRHAIADLAARRGRTAALGDAEPSADDGERNDACACLAAAIADLPPAQAGLLRALELDGEAPAAAARRLGISDGNLKVRRHRARGALRDRLQAICRVCAAHGCMDCTCGRAPRAV